VEALLRGFADFGLFSINGEDFVRKESTTCEMVDIFNKSRRWSLSFRLGSDIRFEGITVSDKPSMIIGRPAGEPSSVISPSEFIGLDFA